MRVGAVIVAAGRGTRAGGGVPKQWRMLCGRPVAAHALAAFADHPQISSRVLVVPPEGDVDEGLAEEYGLPYEGEALPEILGDRGLKSRCTGLWEKASSCQE